MQSDPYKHHHTIPQDMWYVVEMSRDKSLDNFRNLPKRHQIIIQIKKLMVHEHVTYEKLAKRINMKAKQVEKILSGKEDLTIRTIYKLVDALGYDFDIRFFR